MLKTERALALYGLWRWHAQVQYDLAAHRQPAKNKVTNAQEIDERKIVRRKLFKPNFVTRNFTAPT